MRIAGVYHWSEVRTSSARSRRPARTREAAAAGRTVWRNTAQCARRLWSRATVCEPCAPARICCGCSSGGGVRSAGLPQPVHARHRAEPPPGPRSMVDRSPVPALRPRLRLAQSARRLRDAIPVHDRSKRRPCQGDQLAGVEAEVAGQSGGPRRKVTLESPVK